MPDIPSTSSAKGSAVGLWLKKKLLSLLPKRRTVFRALLSSLLLMMPVLLLLTIKVWYVMLPFWAACTAVAYYTGMMGDLSKQVRWMRRMSSRGPIFWIAAAVHRAWVRLLRRLYGDQMDVLPLAPTAIGLTSRTCKSIVLKWHAAPRSAYSTEHYEVELRLTDPAILEVIKESDSNLADWIPLTQDAKLTETQLPAAPLQSDMDYEARVRAANSKGSSEWVSVRFRTKQEAKDGGGSGPGYYWRQGLKEENVVICIPVPEATRGKQVSVVVQPTRLAISVLSEVLLEGKFFADVKSDDVEWELSDVDGQKTLMITLHKAEKDKPFWTCLVQGHPEVDVKGMKRDPKELDELMADCNMSEMMGKMPPMESMMGGDKSMAGMASMMAAMGKKDQ